MTGKVRIHIGDAADMGKRFAESWHRAEAGEVVDETNATFRDL